MTTAIEIISDRLAAVTHLSHGSHDDLADGMSAMEAVAYIAGEDWSDHPQCASPVIAAFMRSWNNALDDADRDRILLPLIPKLVGTRKDAAAENRRATMAADWVIRVQTPAWLRLAGLTEHADRLASFPEITDFAKTPSIKPVLEAARTDAAAAGDAAWAAAGDAAWAAAWAKLRPTVEELQSSAVDLIERMIAV